MPWKQYSKISPLEQIKRRFGTLFDQIFNSSTNYGGARLQISTNLHAHIHQKFQNPSYLDGLEVRSNGSILSNDSAIADFLAIVGIHRASHIFLSEEASVQMTDLSSRTD